MNKLAIFLAGAVTLSSGAFGHDSVNLVVLAPKTLYADGTSSLSITAVDPQNQTGVDVRVRALLDVPDSSSLVLFDGSTGGDGHIVVPFDVPAVDSGVYGLTAYVVGSAERLETDIEIRSMPVILIETDKPIYKPGQTIHGRVLVLTNGLRPVSDEVEIEITDGKGIKIFRETVVANAFGVAPFDLDLATELNFGTWKITASSGYGSGSVDVRVERYVLPRFEVEVDTGRDYFLVDETLTGTVDAVYFFGRSVDGTVEVRASRYVGVWEEYATYFGTLDGGRAEFELPAVEYVSGTEGAGGAGSATLDITVTDTSGHEETTSKLLKIVTSPVQLQLISSSQVITPGLPFEVLVVAETPDGDPLDVTAELTAAFSDSPWSEGTDQDQTVVVQNGVARVSFDVPENAQRVDVNCSVDDGIYSSEASLTVYAAYSPTSSFVHLRCVSDGPIYVGDTVVFDVFKTHDATVYFDVFAAGRTIFSDATTDTQIVFQTTQHMVPSARVVAYIINPNNEISADALPFSVSIAEAAGLDVSFDTDQTLPGEPVQVAVQADTESMVGISIVDESVYALNQGRLNLEEVFNELERRFMEPQAEAHPHYGTYGAFDVLDEANIQVMASSGIEVPQGQEDEGRFAELDNDAGAEGEGQGPPGDDGLAEVTRVRQFFPETWLWVPDLLTDSDGSATIPLTAPDSITTWRLHAVSTSETGLGIAETQMTVFQAFFGEIDLPYAVTRGERFPVQVQVFNYLDTAQSVQVDLAEGEWFDLLDEDSQTVTVDANSVAGAAFLIEPTVLGRNTIEMTFRSPDRADAVRREVLVEPEGTTREIVTNGMLRAGDTVTLDTSMPGYMVPDSGRILLSVTPSLVAQTINGVGDLLGIPYGCGEQNMIFFAPDVEVLRYLDATDQLSPEVRAEAEHFITVGYQRQLTFRHEDGSFSAFGESDESGSLWLTAFVLGTFSGARGVHTIDETVLEQAADWIEGYQLADGSWEPVGFICHTEMVGGMEGNYALTAFVALALADYGAASADVLENAVNYLTDNLSSVEDDPYALAIAALAFARVGSSSAEGAIDRLLDLAISDDVGIHWTPFDIETTAYAALALMEKDMPQANDAIKWIAMQRNGLGGFSSTQDTVMALKALITAARLQRRDVNLEVTATAADPEGSGTVLAEFTVDSTNFDILQIADIPFGPSIELSATGSGEVSFQLMRRFNMLLSDGIVCNDMLLDVVYDAAHVAVDDVVTVTVTVNYLGAADSSGMLLVDVGVPTGFAPVQDSLDALIEGGTASRIEVAGRKVIIYIDDLDRGGELEFAFQVIARFPVRAVIPDSKTYVYYTPDVRAETKGDRITVELFDMAADDDGDGLPNGWEDVNGLDYDDSAGDNGPEGDPDGDGLTNGLEFATGTRADSLDSDGDYAQDGWELRAGTDPTDGHDVPDRVTGDIDGDGDADVVDVQRTVNQVLNLGRRGCDIVADVDGDHRLDAVDVQLVIIAVLTS